MLFFVMYVFVIFLLHSHIWLYYSSLLTNDKLLMTDIINMLNVYSTIATIITH